jgi:hypothetical protein
MYETLLQLVILTLPIYALLTLLIVTHTKRMEQTEQKKKG